MAFRWNHSQLLAGMISLALIFGAVAVGCGTIEESEGDKGTRKASTTTIQISDFHFRPQELEISKGTKITWVNKDRDKHSVTAENDAFDRVLDSGESFSYTFNEAGTFKYHCRLFPNNPGLRAKIVVK